MSASRPPTLREYVAGRWYDRETEWEPQGLVMFSAEPGPELPEGWTYWALGAIGVCTTEAQAMATVERIVAVRAAAKETK